VATLITDVLFKQFLIRTAVYRGQHSKTKNGNGYFTLRYNVRRTQQLLSYDAEWVGSSVSQYYYVFAKKVKKLLY